MKLLECYVQKKEAVQEIYNLTQQIKCAIAEEFYDKIKDFLAKRQILMNKINEIDHEIQGEPGLSLNSIHILKNEIQDILKETIKLDEEIKSQLGKDMVSLKHKIKTLKGSKTMKQAYYPQQRQNAGYFIDRKK